jgi:hypothetical protein
MTRDLFRQQLERHNSGITTPRHSGVYRGQKVHHVPAFGSEPESILARVFLEAAGGPVAVQVGEGAITQIEALGIVKEGRLIVTRVAEDNYRVVKEAVEA